MPTNHVGYSVALTSRSHRPQCIIRRRPFARCHRSYLPRGAHDCRGQLLSERAEPPWGPPHIYICTLRICLSSLAESKKKNYVYMIAGRGFPPPPRVGSAIPRPPGLHFSFVFQYFLGLQAKNRMFFNTFWASGLKIICFSILFGSWALLGAPGCSLVLLGAVG